MNKAIIFDLDGVLVDSKEIHFNALNLALKSINEKYVISEQEQASTYEGMTTKSKLDVLTHTKGLPKELHSYIWQLKQVYSSVMFETLSNDNELMSIFKYLKDNGFLIGVASNSIRQTLTNCLEALGIWRYIDVSLSNEDVNNPKPNPEIYYKCMAMLGVAPDNAIIFEDSNIGREAARASGGHLVEVESRADLTMRFVRNKVISYFE
jgi:HAD superfamily hydrolase (TIGR01509 family)